MTVEEIRREYENLMTEIGADSHSGNVVSGRAFTQHMCEFLTSGVGYIADLNPLYYADEWKNKKLRIDAYYLDDQTHDLTLLVSEFENAPELQTINLTEVREVFGRLQKFYVCAGAKTFLDELDPTNEVYPLAKLLQEESTTISRVRFVLITNKTIGARVKDEALAELGKAYTFKSEFTVWDFSRYCDALHGMNGPEEIEIDCAAQMPGGIPFLAEPTTVKPAEGPGVKEKDYEAYLMMVPGRCIYDWYGRYADRLLEQNVRTFLQFKGKVNKGIRDTIYNSPNRFLAYNNGLTATASGIEVDQSGARILKIRDLQIVNGGQTTGSIYTAGNLHPEKLDSISVQVKLIVVEGDNKNSLVEKVSQYANSQNRIKATAFASNHPCLVRMAEFSRSLIANGAGGVYGTHWYFERSQGQYLNAVNLCKTDKDKKRFQLLHPKNQVITKTDVAKYLLSWDWCPWIVARGGETCFIELLKMRFGTPDNVPGNEAVEGWRDNDTEGNPQFCEYYFKQLVAKAILFKTLDRGIAKQDWCKGYKSQIVTYTIALFRKLVYRQKKTFDLVRIWKDQTIADELMEYLYVLAKKISQYMLANTNGYILSQLCKKEDFWRTIVGTFLNERIPDSVLLQYCRSSMEIVEERDQSIARQGSNYDSAILSKVLDSDDSMWRTMKNYIASRDIEVKNHWKRILDDRISFKRSLTANNARTLLRLWNTMASEYEFPFPVPE